MMFVDRWPLFAIPFETLRAIPSFATIFVVLRSVQHLTVQFGLKTLLQGYCEA